MVKVMNQNLYQWMPYLTALLSAAFSVQQYGLHNTAVILPVLSFVLMQELFADYQWIQKGMLHNACMRGILLFTIGLLGVELLPVNKGSVLNVGITIINYCYADCFIKQCMDHSDCGADDIFPAGYPCAAGTCPYGSFKCFEKGSQECHAAVAGGMLPVSG